MWESWRGGGLRPKEPALAKTPEIGTTAPDFTLPGVLVAGGAAERADYTLSAQRGKPLVLAFYPGDNTSVCTRQTRRWSLTEMRPPAWERPGS